MTTKGKVLVLVSSGHGLPLKDGKVYTGAGYYLNELTVPVRAANESALRTNLLSFEAARARHVGNDPNVERHDPDLWIDEFYFLNQPGQAGIQSDLFYDYRTNVDAYPKWQQWLRGKQPRLLVIWGKYELSFDAGEPERFRKDVPNAEVHVVDGGHFALDTAADEIAALVANFIAVSHS